MATKNYMINDKWLDLDKQNIVELQSVDGELDSLKVNGSEIVTPSGKITITENGTDIDIAQYALADVNVEGGGGSSDFSTAEVTIVNNTNSEVLFPNSAYIENGRLWAPISFSERNTGTVEAIMVEGRFTTYLDGSGSIQVSGDAEYDSEYGNITVYGDCTITIS